MGDGGGAKSEAGGVQASKRLRIRGGSGKQVQADEPTLAAAVALLCIATGAEVGGEAFDGTNESASKFPSVAETTLAGGCSPVQPNG